MKAVKHHDNIIVHFGGASRKGFFNTKDLQNAKGLNQDIEKVKKWFLNNKIDVIDKL